MSALTTFTTDVRAALAVARELGDLTNGVERPLRVWFRDVPYPDLPMPTFTVEFDAEERKQLLVTALLEMLEHCEAAAELDDAEAFERLGPIVDPLWREIMGLRAHAINAEVKKTQDNIRALRAHFEGTDEELAERLLDMPVEDAIEESATDPHLRLLLRTLNIIE